MKPKHLLAFVVPLVAFLIVGSGLLWVGHKFRDVGPTPRLSFFQVQALNEEQARKLLNTTYQVATAKDQMVSGASDVLLCGGLLVIGGTIWMLLILYSTYKAQATVQAGMASRSASPER